MKPDRRPLTTPYEVVAQANDFGALVYGVDLANAVSEAAQEAALRAALRAAPNEPASNLLKALRALWLRHQVLAFPDQVLDHEQLAAVTAAFGDFGQEPYLVPLPAHQRIVEIRRRAEERATPFGTSWHSDWSFQAQPPAATILHSKVVPPSGGDTWFADGFRAYAALPMAERDYLASLTATHSARRSYSPTGYFATDRSERTMAIRSDDSAYATQEHPVVRTHPESGRKALWVNGVYTIGIRELPGPAGAALLDRLCAHATQPEFVYRHRWQPNMLVIWDNRSVQHCATGGYDGHERIMHRTTTAGCEPR